jgi:hypothetical protein
MVDAMPKKAATTFKAKPVTATKPKGKTTRNISAVEKNKALVPERIVNDDDEAILFQKLRPKLPEHDD